MPENQEQAKFKVKIGLDSSEKYARNYDNPDDSKDNQKMLLKHLAKELKHFVKGNKEEPESK